MAVAELDVCNADGEVYTHTRALTFDSPGGKKGWLRSWGQVNVPHGCPVTGVRVRTFDTDDLCLLNAAQLSGQLANSQFAACPLEASDRGWAFQLQMAHQQTAAGETAATWFVRFAPAASDESEVSHD
jgi:hypothetical protein